MRVSERVVEAVKLLPQERFQQRVVEEIVGNLVPQMQEHVVDVIKVISQERVSERMKEEIVAVGHILPERWKCGAPSRFCSVEVDGCILAVLFAFYSTSRVPVNLGQVCVIFPSLCC